MKVSFYIEERSHDDKKLIIDMQLIHNRHDDKMFSTAYMLDISMPVELSMLREILGVMERETSRHAAEKINIMKVVEHRHIQHLEDRIRQLETLVRENTGIEK